MKAYAHEILEADDAALIEASGAKDVVLIGHDWGALIAWNYAMFGRLPISKLIIMNVPHPAIWEKQLFNVRQWLRSLLVGKWRSDRKRTTEQWLPEAIGGRSPQSIRGYLWKDEGSLHSNSTLFRV